MTAHAPELDAVGAAIEVLDRDLLVIANDEDAPHYLDDLQLLARLRGLRIHLAELESIVEARAARTMPDDPVEIAGVGVFERHGGATRKQWDHAGVQSRLVTRALEDEVDETTGEVTPSSLDAETAQAVAALIFECARPEWRVTKLRAHGVRFDDLCETTYGRRTVQFIAADPIAVPAVAEAAA